MTQKPPTQNTGTKVGEHLRRYRDGKIAIVKAHHRPPRGKQKGPRLKRGQMVILAQHLFDSGVGSVEAIHTFASGDTSTIYKSTVMKVVRARVNPILEEGGRPLRGMTEVALATGVHAYLRRDFLEPLGLNSSGSPQNVEDVRTLPSTRAEETNGVRVQPRSQETQIEQEGRRRAAAERIRRTVDRPRGAEAFGAVTVNRQHLVEVLRHFYGVAHLLDYSPERFEEAIEQIIEEARLG